MKDLGSNGTVSHGRKPANYFSLQIRSRKMLFLLRKEKRHSTVDVSAFNSRQTKMLALFFLQILPTEGIFSTCAFIIIPRQ